MSGRDVVTSLVTVLEERAAIEKAAQRVRDAAIALDRHRHAGAPSLERELGVAMSAYFDVVERYFGRNPTILSEAS